MGKYGSIDIQGFKKLQEELNKMKNYNDFVESCAKELAARLLAKVVRRTPVGDYSREVEVVAKKDSKNHKKGDTYKKKINPSGKMGGTLRRGWTIGEIRKDGGIYSIEIINPVEYALMGHTKSSKNGES